MIINLIAATIGILGMIAAGMIINEKFGSLKGWLLMFMNMFIFALNLYLFVRTE